MVVKDLFLVCDDGNGDQHYQIWINNKDDGFSLATFGMLPRGTQSITFSDIGMHTHSIVSYLSNAAIR